jgi:hypothetical protein
MADLSKYQPGMWGTQKPDYIGGPYLPQNPKYTSPGMQEYKQPTTISQNYTTMMEKYKARAKNPFKPLPKMAALSPKPVKPIIPNFNKKKKILTSAINKVNKVA